MCVCNVWKKGDYKIGGERKRRKKNANNNHLGPSSQNKEYTTVMKKGKGEEGEREEERKRKEKENRKHTVGMIETCSTTTVNQRNKHANRGRRESTHVHPPSGLSVLVKGTGIKDPKPIPSTAHPREKEKSEKRTRKEKEKRRNS